MIIEGLLLGSKETILILVLGIDFFMTLRKPRGQFPGMLKLLKLGYL